MPSSGIRSLDNLLGGVGYPSGAAILVTGPAGIGKESLGYWFARAGLEGDDFCVYATRLPKRDVLRDMSALGLSPPKREARWIAQSGGDEKLDVENVQEIQAKVETELGRAEGRGVRVVADFLSSVLALNSQEASYRFVSGFVESVKRRDGVIVATLEEGMHGTQSVASMHQLFDGVIEFSFYRTGLRVTPVMRVAKMSGVAPRHDSYAVSFGPSGLLLDRIESQQPPLTVSEKTSAPPPSLGRDPAVVFEYLVKSFAEDYVRDRLPVEQSGWRTRIAAANATGLSPESFYGKEGQFGPVLKELVSSGLVETRYFSGQRGRGGEVTKFRISYEKEHVRRLFEEMTRGEGH